MKNVLTNLIVELGILFAVIYIIFTALTTSNEVIEIVCYCAITILAVVEWRDRQKSLN